MPPYPIDDTDEDRDLERQRQIDEEEYQRGVTDTKRAQEAGPPGSPEREAAYLEMEKRWADEGFDG